LLLREVTRVERMDLAAREDVVDDTATSFAELENEGQRLLRTLGAPTSLTHATGAWVPEHPVVHPRSTPAGHRAPLR
jgi:hypothetical protein